MLLSNSDYSIIFQEIQRNLTPLVDRLEKDLSTAVLILTTLERGSELRWNFPKQLRPLYVYCMASHYLSEEYREYFQFELSLHIERTYKNESELIILRQLIDSSYWKSAIIHLNIFGRNTEDFFGSIRPLINKYKDRRNVYKKLPKRPKEPVFRRGYKDKGSRVLDSHGREEYKKDWSSRKLQEDLEARKRTLEDTHLLIQGWIM